MGKARPKTYIPLVVFRACAKASDQAAASEFLYTYDTIVCTYIVTDDVCDGGLDVILCGILSQHARPAPTPSSFFSELNRQIHTHAELNQCTFVV